MTDADPLQHDQERPFHVLVLLAIFVVALVGAAEWILPPSPDRKAPEISPSAYSFIRDAAARDRGFAAVVRSRLEDGVIDTREYRELHGLASAVPTADVDAARADLQRTLHHDG